MLPSSPVTAIHSYFPFHVLCLCLSYCISFFCSFIVGACFLFTIFHLLVWLFFHFFTKFLLFFFFYFFYSSSLFLLAHTCNVLLIRIYVSFFPTCTAFAPARIHFIITFPYYLNLPSLAVFSSSLTHLMPVSHIPTKATPFPLILHSPSDYLLFLLPPLSSSPSSSTSFSSFLASFSPSTLPFFIIS